MQASTADAHTAASALHGGSGRPSTRRSSALEQGCQPRILDGCMSEARAGDASPQPPHAQRPACTTCHSRVVIASVCSLTSRPARAAHRSHHECCLAVFCSVVAPGCLAGRSAAGEMWPYRTIGRNGMHVAADGPLDALCRQTCDDMHAQASPLHTRARPGSRGRILDTSKCPLCGCRRSATVI